MDTLESMRAFARVVELGGFAPAARALDLSPAMVTKHVASLERRLGVRLLNRTTRQVGTTEAGRAYYERCVELLQGIEDAEANVGALAGAPRGLLRVTAPVEFGNLHLAPVVAAFLNANPDVSVSLELTNRLVDMVHEGVDIAVRIAPKLDGSYVARKLASSTLVLVAAPAYLRARGTPAVPEELAHHSHLCFAEPRVRDELALERDGAVTPVRLKPRMQSNGSESLLVAAREGAGIFMLPSFLAGADLAAGRLAQVLPDYRIGTLGVYAVYPHRTFLPAKVRAFLDALTARYGQAPEHDPWWPPGSRPARRRPT